MDDSVEKEVNACTEHQQALTDAAVEKKVGLVLHVDSGMSTLRRLALNHRLSEAIIQINKEDREQAAMLDPTANWKRVEVEPPKPVSLHNSVQSLFARGLFGPPKDSPPSALARKAAKKATKPHKTPKWTKHGYRW